MNFGSFALWGFVATIVLTTLMAGSQRLGLSRMSIPHLVGTMFTPNRDRALVYGTLAHMVNGWAFALVYALIFESWGRATWYLGALLGLGHGLFLLLVILPLVPGLHPRMASETHGPDPTRGLEPPGFLGMYYGRPTAILTLLAHVAYGATLGAFYQPT